jgi:hypothetical protein
VRFFQIGAAARAFVMMRFALSQPPLSVKLNAHLVNHLEIAFPEILVFVPARLFISRHACLNFPYTEI